VSSLQHCSKCGPRPRRLGRASPSTPCRTVALRGVLVHRVRLESTVPPDPPPPLPLSPPPASALKQPFLLLLLLRDLLIPPPLLLPDSSASPSPSLSRSLSPSPWSESCLPGPATGFPGPRRPPPRPPVARDWPPGQSVCVECLFLRTPGPARPLSGANRHGCTCSCQCVFSLSVLPGYAMYSS